ncbi:MAG: HlyC/CorC family transporter [Clostridia bacterium]|nr:HlyC/CorC family transporter [Clostridia bacterium]
MDPDSWLLLLLYAALVMCCAYFAAAESALAAANPIRLRSAAEEGNKNAAVILKILDDFDRTLTAVLIGNNLAGLGCASVATVLTLRVLRSYGGRISDPESVAAAVSTAATTVIVFLLGEIIPKSYATDHSEKVALNLARSLRFVRIVLTPLVFVFSGVSRVASRLVRAEEEPTVTEEELSTMIETIGEEGVIDEEQSDLLQSALEFSKTTVADVLTVRADVTWIDVALPPDEIARAIRQSNHSRLLVCDGSLDRVVGVLVIRDFLKQYIDDPRVDVRGVMKQPFFVPLSASIDDLLAEMSRNRFYLAVVRDPAGATAGVVTIEDFLEELVGEIFDEDDVVDDKFMKLGGNHFRVSGACTIGEMFRRMRYTPASRQPGGKTVHVWVLEQLGHEPREDDSFVCDKLTVTVTEVTDGRVLEVEVKLATPELEIAPAEEPKEPPTDGTPAGDDTEKGVGTHD